MGSSVSGWELAASGLLGAVMGGTQSAVKSIDDDEEQKRKKEMERLREEMAEKRAASLEALRRGEITRVENETAEFYKKTGPQTKSATYTDQTGDETEGASAGIVTSEMKESRSETANRRLEEARGTGKKHLIDQSYNELKDIRAEEKQDIAAKTLEDRTKNDAERLRLQALRDDAKSETERKRLDVLIAKVSGGGADAKEPAKIREVKALAELAFSGDIEKATSFAYGTNAKPRAEAVMSMFAALKNTDADNGKSSDLMKKAEQMVDQLREKDTASRGGVKVGGEKAAEPKAAPKEAAKPKSKAEYEALPSGALYVNPRDGKTYRKP